MESSSTSTKFWFRDHAEMEDTTQSDASSETSSVSSDCNPEAELDSMTGKGIKHLCSELLELKTECDEDFHRNIFSNYAAFVRIFEEVQGVENELMQLRSQLGTQKRLVKDLMDGTHLKVLSEETMKSIIQESEFVDTTSPTMLEMHINDFSETIDVLLLEKRVDEAIAILEQEDENLERIEHEDNSQSDLLMLYNNVISEKKAMLTSQLTVVAENPKAPAPELQKALARLCRLGDFQLATQLLLKYYHLRITTGIHKLQSTKSVSRWVYMKELAKLVFSMISQAAQSFVMLHGDASSHASELIQWACEEIETFVALFNRYVKSITEISGGLANAVEAMQLAISYCSLLETQKLVLRPCLIKLLRPCMEEVLQIHIDHFRKVIAIFTARDGWDLGRYLIPGILNEGSSSMVIGQQPKYCLLTNSGRKFVTLLQTIKEDVTPLLAIQMEGSILRGLMDLFIAYKIILEKAITFGGHLFDKGSKICAAESLEQQVSLLANVCTLEDFWSNIIVSLFKSIRLINSKTTKKKSIDLQPREVKDCMWLIQKATSQLRAHFCTQYINRMRSPEVGNRIMQEISVANKDELSLSCNGLPSVGFQVLFWELRKLHKHVEDGVFDLNWLMELLRELMEAIFVWVSNGKEIWETAGESSSVLNSDNFEQFILDVHFLTEIARQGAYFFKKPLVLEALVDSAFTSVGLDPKRDSYDHQLAKMAATQAMQKLLAIGKTKSLLSNEPNGNLEEKPLENQSDNETDVQDESTNSTKEFLSTEDGIMTQDAGEVSSTVKKANKAESSPEEPFLDMVHSSAAAESASIDVNQNEQGDDETDNTIDEAYDELHGVEHFDSSQPSLVSGNVTSELLNHLEDGLSSGVYAPMLMIQEVADEDPNTEFSETEIASAKDSVRVENTLEPNLEDQSEDKFSHDDFCSITKDAEYQ